MKIQEQTKMYSQRLYSNVPRPLEHFINHLHSNGVTDEMLDTFQSNIKDIMVTHREAERRITEESDHDDFDATIGGQAWYAANGKFDNDIDSMTYIGCDGIGSILASIEMDIIASDLIPYAIGIYGSDIAYYLINFGGGSYMIGQVPNAHRLGIRIQCQLNSDDNIYDITQLDIDPPVIARVV